MNDRAPMTQEAPYPVVLEDLVNDLGYRPGWTFLLETVERCAAAALGEDLA